ncbi:enoyl-CoA hydratase/isomerase family protein [Pseudorhodoferax sp.]|uniref:enoyl-CoA hydratase/isomerase family protein n=1 Tax=Pseudorhodoferax sp. TaxID=1993553 RepID=UPI002DD62033|nr:enoyl-CoA hydratase-related protein [Pseudorhodoferax sp.]
MPVRLETEGPVALITLDRPEALNALDLASLRALRGHLATVRDRDDLRVAILTGAGERAFCAGADLKQAASASYAQAFTQGDESAADLGLYIRLMDLAALQLHKPVIAAVNGHCLGGGLELALQCPLRIASERASFGLPEVAVGSIPAVSGLHRLLQAVPSAHAMQMVLSADRIDAAHAARIGLVSEVTEPGALLDRAFALARRIAGHAPLAVQAVNRLARQTRHLGEADAQALTELHWGVLRDTADRNEGRTAFAAKRAPHYLGR